MTQRKCGSPASGRPRRGERSGRLGSAPKTFQLGPDGVCQTIARRHEWNLSHLLQYTSVTGTESGSGNSMTYFSQCQSVTVNYSGGLQRQEDVTLYNIFIYINIYSISRELQTIDRWELKASCVRQILPVIPAVRPYFSVRKNLIPQKKRRGLRDVVMKEWSSPKMYKRWLN